MQASLEIRIRRAMPADAPRIAKMLYDSFLEYEGLHLLRKALRPLADEIQARI